MFPALDSVEFSLLLPFGPMLRDGRALTNAQGAPGTAEHGGGDPRHVPQVASCMAFWCWGLSSVFQCQLQAHPVAAVTRKCPASCWEGFQTLRQRIHPLASPQGKESTSSAQKQVPAQAVWGRVPKAEGFFGSLKEPRVQGVSWRWGRSLWCN